MLRDLTQALDHFDRYIHKLPLNEQLQATMASLYDEFVGFCVEAILFYKKWPFCEFVHLPWELKLI